MDPNELEAPCIEIEFLTGSRKGFSVAEYEKGQRVVKSLASQRVISSQGVRWALAAPPVEHLTEKWQKPANEKIRICNRDVYDLQMRQLLGII